MSILSSSTRIKRLGNRTILIWFISVVCWVVDRVFCDFWIKFNIPYFHSIFHVLIFLASYSSIVLFALFAAEYRVPHLGPVLTYWPGENKYECFRIPFIYFTNLKRKNKPNNLIYSHDDLDSKNNSKFF